MLAAWLILGQAPAPAPRLEWDGLIWTFLAMAGVIGLAWIALALVGRWRRRVGEEDTTGDQMASFRELYERGELSQEEYDRIKDRLGRRLRQELNLPRPEVPPQPPTPPAPNA